MSRNATESDQLTLFAEDSHANLSAAQESETEHQMTATSGRKCYERSEELGRAGLLARTLLASSRWTAGLYSMKYALRWKLKGIRSKRLLFQLAPSVRPTGGTEFGLLETPLAQDAKHSGRNPKEQGKRLGSTIGLLPTPTLMDTGDTTDLEKIQERRERCKAAKKNGNGFGVSLCEKVRLLPTPTARDHKGANSEEHCADGSHMNQLPNYLEHGPNTGYKLQPGFVEWMLGYPPGWTDIEPED